MVNSSDDHYNCCLQTAGTTSPVPDQTTTSASPAVSSQTLKCLVCTHFYTLAYVAKYKLLLGKDFTIVTEQIKCYKSPAAKRDGIYRNAFYPFVRYTFISDPYLQYP